MKRFSLFSNIIAIAAVCVISVTACDSTTGNNSETKQAAESQVAESAKGSIVYFNLDRVLLEYDMANDLRSEVESKVASINQEVNRRASKLDKDIKAFQDKINKGTITQTTAQAQSQKLAEQQQTFEQFANQKQQEILEEQNVMTNQIADAISTFVKAFNEEKGYAMIIATQGDILSMPVVTGDPSLDITDALLEGLNAEYVKSKSTK